MRLEYDKVSTLAGFDLVNTSNRFQNYLSHKEPISYDGLTSAWMDGLSTHIFACQDALEFFVEWLPKEHLMYPLASAYEKNFFVVCERYMDARIEYPTNNHISLEYAWYLSALSSGFMSVTSIPYNRNPYNSSKERQAELHAGIFPYFGAYGAYDGTYEMPERNERRKKSLVGVVDEALSAPE